MTKITAIFERGVFRPIEQVHCQDGTEVELSFEVAHTPSSGHVTITVGPLGLPVITPPAGSRTITGDDVAKGLDEF